MDFKKLIENEEFETKKIEFKEIVSHKNYEKWLKSIAAFANTDGGKLFFGVDDDENPVGLDKETLKSEILYINEVCDKKLKPRVNFEFQKFKFKDDLYLLEVKVYKSVDTPIWLTRSDSQDVIYIRREGQSVIAHGDEIEELVLKSKRKPFDKEASMNKYNLQDYEMLNDLYKEKNKTDESLSLKQLKSIDSINFNDYVTKGLLLFSDNYDGSNCNVSCRIWPSLSKGSSEMIDKTEYKGNILKVLDFARNYISLYTKSGLVKENDGNRTLLVSYPKAAIEEALVNAVAHRDYYIDGAQIDIDIFKDRIEITSPGNFILPGNAQDYAINRIPSRRRNEVICSILEKCKLMEKSGTGFDKIVNEYSFAPIEYQPKVYSDPAQFIITLYDLSYKKENNSGFVNKKISFKKPKKGKREYDSKILLYCLDEPKTRLEIQNYINLSDRKYFVSSILNPLIDFGLLLTTQKSSRAPNQQYYTNPKKVVLK